MKPEILERIGLTKYESIIYISLLQIGTAKTGEILKKSELNTGKIYEILESLKVKGLVSESVIDNVRHFTAAPPSKIKEYLDKKKKELDKDEEYIESLTPDLEKLRMVKLEKVQARVYTGFKGIKTAVNEALELMKKGEEIYAMGVTTLKDKRFNDFWKRWQIKRIEKKANQKMIFSERSKFFELFKKSKYTRAKVLTGITPVTVDVFGDVVLILNYNEPVSCTLIHDKNTAKSFKQFFEELWKVGKK